MHESEQVPSARRRLLRLSQALATAYQAVRAWVPSFWLLRRSVRLPVVTVGQHEGIRATVGTLTLRRVRGARRAPRTPALLVSEDGFTSTDQAFEDAKSNALAWSTSQRPSRRRGTVAWTLTDAHGQPLPSVRGNSTGAAFAVGLAFLYGLSRSARRPVDRRAVISAAVTEGGLLATVTGLNHKSRAVREAGHRLVVAHDDGPAAHAARQTGRPHTDTAVSVHQAVERAVLRRSRTVPLLALALVAASVGTVLLLRSNDAAQRSERATTVQQLTDRSRIEVGSAPDTAAQLALRAARTDPQSMTARTAQLDAAYFDPRLTDVLDAGPSPQAIAYDLHGTTLAVASHSGVTLYSASGHRYLARMPAVHGTVTALAFTPSHRLLVATDQGLVALWTPSRGKGAAASTPWRVVFQGQGRTQAIAVSPDGSLAAWATLGDGVYTAGLDGAAAVRAAPADARITSIALPADGRLVVGRLPDKQKPALLLYDLTRPQDQPRVLLRRGNLELASQGATALVVADSGHRLISAHLDDSVRVWDTSTYQEQKEISVPGSAVALALSRDGRTATVALQSFPAIGTVDRQSPGAAVLTLDLTTGRQLGEAYAASYACLTAVLATAPGGDEAAVVTVAGRVTFWRRVHPSSRGAVHRIVSDPSHPSSVLVLHRPGTVLRYRAAALNRPPEPVVDARTYGMGLDMALSPNGHVLAVSHASGVISLWKYPQGTLLGKPLDTGTPHGANRLVFAPDGRILAAGDDSGHAILFDLRSHRRGAAIKESGSAAVNALCFSADSRSLVVARGDGATGVIDTATGRLVHEVTMSPVASTVTRHEDGYFIGFTDGHLGRYDRSLRLVGVLGGGPPQNYVVEATESPDHSLIATTGPQQDGVLTDTSTGAAVLHLPTNEHPDSISDHLTTSFISNGFSADGRYAVFGTARGQLTSVALEGSQLRDRLCALLTEPAKECR
ncbi:WD40 repeat domain-containing protein [Streptomyces canus]|uniref:WD40 repeat domain-containing protein n=1 Tax=Streptomyces canus TaxID=58343 RepID=UPI003683EDD7